MYAVKVYSYFKSVSDERKGSLIHKLAILSFHIIHIHYELACKQAIACTRLTTNLNFTVHYKLFYVHCIYLPKHILNTLKRFYQVEILHSQTTKNFHIFPHMFV